MTNVRRWLTLCTLGLFFFMVIVDGSIVTIAVPAIAKGLSVDSAQVNLIIVIYLIVISAALLTFGQLGDQIGRIRLFRAGTVVFLLGTLGAGLGPSLRWVLAGRLLQGIGAGMTMANSYAIVTDIFPKEMLGRAFGIESVFISLGALAGPGLGGFLLSYSSWRAIFLVNLPIGFMCLIFEWWAFPTSTKPGKAAIDWIGSGWLVLAAISFYSFANSLMNRPLVALVSLLVIGIASVGFNRAERRVAKPLLNFNIFENRVFSRSLLASMLSFIAAYFFTLLAPLYLQMVLHFSNQLTGLLMMVSPVVAIIANPAAGWATDRIDAVKMMQIGMAILVLAEVCLVFTNGRREPLVIIMISGMIAIGTAAFGTASNTVMMSRIRVEQRGMAGALNSLTREFGMVVGTTLASVVYYGRLSIDNARIITTITNQSPALLLNAQSLAYVVATALLVIGFWLIRPKRIENVDGKTK